MQAHFIKTPHRLRVEPTAGYEGPLGFGFPSGSPDLHATESLLVGIWPLENGPHTGLPQTAADQQRPNANPRGKKSGISREQLATGQYVLSGRDALALGLTVLTSMSSDRPRLPSFLGSTRAHRRPGRGAVEGTDCLHRTCLNRTERHVLSRIMVSCLST